MKLGIPKEIILSLVYDKHLKPRPRYRVTGAYSLSVTLTVKSLAGLSHNAVWVETNCRKFSVREFISSQFLVRTLLIVALPRFASNKAYEHDSLSNTFQT